MEHIRAFDREGTKYRKIVLRGGKVVGAVAIGLREQVPALLKAVTESADATAIRQHLTDIEFDVGALG